MSKARTKRDADDDDESSGREDTSAKFVSTSVTLADLRKDDESWAPLRGSAKLRYQAILRQQISFFADKPFIDAGHDDIREYTGAFLAHPGDYGWTLDFEPNFFCELAYEGFLSTSLEIRAGPDFMLQVMLPWIAQKRSSLDFVDIHISHQVRKRAKRYTMTVDTAYDEVMLGCIHQHGEGWLYRGLRWLLRRLFKESYSGSRDIQVGVHSFELWDADGRLVAGDLGYTVGGVYTSMTGFRLKESQGAGDVQLVLTAGLLQKMGYLWWDLGMVMRYKAGLGARVITRDAFVTRLRRDRDKRVQFEHARIGGQELLGYLQRAIGDEQELASKASAEASVPVCSDILSL